jgi:hypothetical protein
MTVKGRLVNTWYWKVARSMRAQGSQRQAMESTTSVSGRLRRAQACQAQKATAGTPSQKMIRLPVS